MEKHISLFLCLSSIGLILAVPARSTGESPPPSSTTAPPSASAAFAGGPFGGKRPRPSSQADGDDKNEADKEHTSSEFFIKRGCPICPCQYPATPFFPTFFSPRVGTLETNSFYEPWINLEPVSLATRKRRAADYWHNLGPTNSFLASSDLAYLTQKQMQDQFSRFGPTLHMGMVDGADFNFPNDFNKFNEPGYMEIRVDQNVVYELTGPLEVVPNGNLVGPIIQSLDAFTSINLRTGFYRLVGVQKNGIMKIADTNSNVVFAVDCTKQRQGSCQNLQPVRNLHDFPKFVPKLNQIYTLSGLLDVTSTEFPPANTSPTTLATNTGEYQVIGISSRSRFSVRQSSTNVVFFVDCNQQVNGRCENLMAKS